jgi:hemin uptake protein HemP
LEREKRVFRKTVMNADPNSAVAGTASFDGAPCYSTHELFGAARLVTIVHAGQIYRMQITRMGKLILTK